MSKLISSLIISVYDNVFYLKAVLDSLRLQTDSRFEVIISEDAEHKSVKEFIENYQYNGKLRHLSQPDTGWRKNRALNRAIEASETDYLVFIDGDCVLHPRFMEFHHRKADPGLVLAGKRIKLDKQTTDWLLKDDDSLLNFQKYLLGNYHEIKQRGSEFMEEGVFINPGSVMGFIPRLRTMKHLKGCNMSFSKKAIYDINGFDEDYISPATGEDADLAWRFAGLGYKMRSLRNLSVQYHLFHSEGWTDQQENLEMMKQKQEQNLYFCSNGLVKKP